MGYTTHRSNILIGLGVSAISDTGNAFAQNDKTVHGYYQKINNNTLSVQKGYFLSDEDRRFKKYILDLSCHGETIMDMIDQVQLEIFTFPVLKKLEADNLVE
jgi:oxygen-independent coproporphyrinogen-3 oxidase